MKKSVLIWGLLGVMVCVTGCADKSKIKAEDYISLGEYEGLEVTRVSTEVTDEEIQQQIDSILSDYATTEEITDRTDVQEGDVVNIDYTGTLDGEVFDGGSAQGFDLEIGSGRFIDGFEEGLIGADVGDTVTLNLTFPGEYSNNPDLAGKDVVFAVKINSISKSELPEFNDAFIAQESSGQFSTVVDFKAYMTEQMESSRKEYADSIMYTELLDEAVDNAEVIKDIPEEYVQEKIDEMIRTTKSGAEAYGMDFDTYLQSYMGLDEESFNEKVQEASQTIAKQSLVLQAIADAEEIEITDEELEQKVNDLVDLYGYESEKDLKEHMSVDDIKESMLIKKVEEFLADHAVITVSE